MMFAATVFDQVDVFLTQDYNGSGPPFGFPRLALERLRACCSKMGNFLVQTHLIGIFEWVEELFLVEGNATTTTALDRASTTTWTPLPSNLQEITRSERAMLRACTRTMQILQYLLDNTPFDRRYLEQLRQELERSRPDGSSHVGAVYSGSEPVGHEYWHGTIIHRGWTLIIPLRQAVYRNVYSGDRHGAA
ncbi:hypothetical protein BJX68DRAFT_227617 [Aspergillus pseudodeflectus]|uniref:Uncharacterized protein n=1 Tax=Aspergillus pseudodeflectus TaxID=176178 RepID=A0ABR4L3D3_9EURO